MPKRKIAILGGGPAGLAAAYRLTEADPDRYDITIYQMGWRLGGKGTSGYRRWLPPDSNVPIWNRIEEHGLHILFGFYDEFWAVIRRCYEELGRPSDHPLATVEKAFEPRVFGTTMYRHHSRWKQVSLTLRRFAQAPGTTGSRGGTDVAENLASAISSFPTNALRGTGGGLQGGTLRERLCDALADRLTRVLTPVLQRAAQPGGRFPGLRFWQRHLRHWLGPVMRLFGATYLFWLGVDYYVALVRAVLEADLLNHGDFESLDHLDYREWLRQADILPEAEVSALAAMIYHAAFSYEEGEPDRPRIAAGSALRLILRASGRRSGSAYYRMRGGMGEVVFVPVWQALAQRGVKFEFFQKVEALRLDPTQTRVEAVEITRQTGLAGGRDTYEPAIEVKGVEAFPSEPLWDQLERGDTQKHVKFESYYESSYPRGSERTLQRGTDFDEVILATPVATLPYVAGDLLDHTPAWQTMVDKVQSVQTLSLQLWFDATHAELGWEQPALSDPHTLLSMYAKPMSTWVPMDQTLPRENWPSAMEPRAVSYFTGAQPGPKFAPSPQSEPDFPERQMALARIFSEQFLRNNAAEDLLPKLENPMTPPHPRFELFHDPAGRTGSARFAAQLARSNCEPSERCTLGLPGATAARLAAGETGYENLVIAGDWIANDVVLACMEGAFTGGLLAGDAILARG